MHDESVADFTLRHFGPEVLARVAAPLLTGVFGGDVRNLSVRAVMPAFVRMERTHGSLIAALHSVSQPVTDNLQPATIFTTLRSGLGTLVDRLVAAIPPHWLRLNTSVTAIEPNSHLTEKTDSPPWSIHTSTTGKHRGSDTFDTVLLATPLDATRSLLTPLDSAAAQLLPTGSSSAVLVAFAYLDATRVPLPPGFGFLVPPIDPVISVEGGAFAAEVERPPHFAFGSSTSAVPTTPSLLLACTFADQKFPHRVPPGGRLIRAFFGGTAADRIARCNNDEIAAIARLELARILNSSTPISAVAPTPAPVPALTVVRRWPNSLPQYAVGHLDRVAEIESRLRTHPGLTLLGNALHGVGLPDLIRDARQAARTAAC